VVNQSYFQDIIPYFQWTLLALSLLTPELQRLLQLKKMNGFSSSKEEGENKREAISMEQGVNLLLMNVWNW
jgi:hypothetical protein